MSNRKYMSGGGGSWGVKQGPQTSNHVVGKPLCAPSSHNLSKGETDYLQLGGEA